MECETLSLDRIEVSIDQEKVEDTEEKKVKSDRRLGETFFKPGSIAVIGASPSEDKLSNVLLENIKEAKSSDEIFPVNPNYDEIEGMRCFDSIKDVRKKIDLAVVSVPSDLVPDIVEGCVQADVGNVVVISSGFSETGTEKGEELERKLVEAVEDSSTRLLGPNTLGYYLPSEDLDLTFLGKDAFERPSEGGIGLISQSGSLGVDFLNELSSTGSGVSLFLSLGNKADINECDVIDYLWRDDKTECIAMYLEGISEGERFFDLCSSVTEEKPMIMLKGGKSESGEKAASLHTGKMGGAYKITRDIMDQLNIIEADDEVELLDFAQGFNDSILPKGKRVLVITNGGGNGIIAVDRMENEWKEVLDLVSLSSEFKTKITDVVPDFISPGNPIDLSAEASNEDYLQVLDLVGKHDISDLVVLGITVSSTIDGSIADDVKELSEKHSLPIITYLKGFNDGKKIKDEFDKNGLPAYPSVRRATNVAGAIMRWNEGCKR
ncbi:MAG: CoA-binding protein [Candidatus Thermoplasmatota archaeon]|nr:CoA-binding protein [Candidatus Thermoplasmatota archaeon]